MPFKHNIIQLPTLSRIDGNGGPRLYETPTGEKYPSVTSILGATANKSGLYEWQRRVGKEEASKITNRAATRGTKIHKLCEDVLNGIDVDKKKLIPTVSILFGQVEPVLHSDVDNIRAIEARLFSHKLRAAGSVDLVADYKGELSIIDFKTSLRPKKIEWIRDYFLQTAMYSYMLYEMTGLVSKKLVVIVANEENLRGPQVFVQSPSDYIDEAANRCKMFHSAKSG